MENGKRVRNVKNSFIATGKRIAHLKGVTKLKKIVFPPTPPDKNIQDFAVIKKTELSKLVACYNSVLSRSEQDGINMSDLNNLQRDIEKLLSTCGVRQRILFKENQCLRRKVNRGKKGKFSFKQEVPIIRRRLEPKIKLSTNKVRLSKNKSTASSSCKNVRKKRNIPKVIFPKNDTAQKFWSSIEPFCAQITKDDVLFLDDLIKESSEKLKIQYSEGEHYARTWFRELFVQEQSNSTFHRQTKKAHEPSKIEKYDYNKMIDTFTSPLSQRLLGVLIEENLINVTNENATNFDETLQKFNDSQSKSCMEKLLKEQLHKEGLLPEKDNEKDSKQPNAIDVEMKRCHQELLVVNEQNIHELQNLRKAAVHNLQVQNVKESLINVDSKIRETYSKLMELKHNSVQLPADELTKRQSEVKKYEEEAQKLMQTQLALENELSDLEDLS